MSHLQDKGKINRSYIDVHRECGSDLLQFFQEVSKWHFNFFQLFVAPRETNKMVYQKKKTRNDGCESKLYGKKFRWLSVRGQFPPKTTIKLYFNIRSSSKILGIAKIVRQLRRSPKTFRFVSPKSFSAGNKFFDRSLAGVKSGEITINSDTWLQQSPQNSDVCWLTPGVAASWTPVVVDEEAVSFGVGTLMPPGEKKREP